MKEKALWRQVINSRYGVVGEGWIPNLETPRRVSNVWKGILSRVEVNSDLHAFFLSSIEIHLGDGKRVHSWLDKWLRNTKLKDEFPRLFSLSTKKEESLEYFARRKEISGGWNLSFRRVLRPWEGVEVNRLYLLLLESPSSSGQFTVASVRSWLEAHQGPKLLIPKLI